jgi:hypothetical protein
VVSVLEEFFQQFNKSKALREELRLGKLPVWGASSWIFRVPFGNNLGKRRRK